jgi:curved DNA-binding protein CbpA
VPDQWRKFNIASAIQQQAQDIPNPISIDVPPPVMTPPPPVMTPPPPVMAPPPPVMTRPTSVSTSTATAKSESKKKPLTEALQKQIAEIEAHFDKRTQYTHYEQLEIPNQADDAMITAQFKKKAAALHVDRFVRFEISDETLEKIKQVFISVNQAYQVLSNAQSRKEYDLTLKHTSNVSTQNLNSPIKGATTTANVVGGVVQATQDLNQIFKAEKITKEALHFIKIGKIDLAIARAKESLEINAEDVLALAAKTFGEFLQAKANQATVVVIGEFRDILQGLHANNEQREEILLYLGRVQLALNDLNNAKKSFEKAIALNPLFAEAKSELTLLLRRQEEEESKKKGLFGSFLKK